VIKRYARESKPRLNPRIVPPKGAPNVLLIMTDDADFGVSKESNWPPVPPSGVFNLTIRIDNPNPKTVNPRLQVPACAAS